MPPLPAADVYSPGEIARAAGVPETDAVAALGHADRLVPWAEAVRAGRALAYRDRGAIAAARPLFTAATARATRPARVPLVLSSTLHVGIVAATVFITTLGLTPRAATLTTDAAARTPMRLVFLATPGPGGGGGGGGLLQKAPPPKALSEGRHTLSSPLPRRVPPKRIEPVVAPPEPKRPPIAAEQLPVVIAPIVSAPADPRTRPGVMTQADAQTDSRGPGRGGGVGTGTGTGLGEGDGAGIGPGSGGGTGGGPYRAGSGIEPPRLLQEIRADYTEEARRRGVSGDVVLEIVVRRDGGVGDVRVLQGLGFGLDERAVQAVRQWRFAPARRLNAPVDVIVEVAVEFKLR
jgi:TonB family protein